MSLPLGAWLQQVGEIGYTQSIEIGIIVAD
jgi:hypothetical protein